MLTVTCTETSKKVQPIPPEVGKQYLEEYYRNLDLWLAQKMQELSHQGKKKRAISFNQADMQHSKWNKGSEHSSAGHGPQSLRGPHRRMSVDVKLLQMKQNSTALEKEPSCAGEAKTKPPSRESTVTTYIVVVIRINVCSCLHSCAVLQGKTLESHYTDLLKVVADIGKDLKSAYTDKASTDRLKKSEKNRHRYIT